MYARGYLREGIVGWIMNVSNFTACVCVCVCVCVRVRARNGREWLSRTHLLCVRHGKDDRVEQLQLLDVVLRQIAKYCLAAMGMAFVVVVGGGGGGGGGGETVCWSARRLI
jgi:hypothetical protein